MLASTYVSITTKHAWANHDIHVENQAQKLFKRTKKLIFTDKILQIKERWREDSPEQKVDIKK